VPFSFIVPFPSLIQLKFHLAADGPYNKKRGMRMDSRNPFLCLRAEIKSQMPYYYTTGGPSAAVSMA
jgi:hypothetical protein